MYTSHKKVLSLCAKTPKTYIISLINEKQTQSTTMSLRGNKITLAWESSSSSFSPNGVLSFSKLMPF
jgi:hypothetical protein